MQQKIRTKNPGIKVDLPSQGCNDDHCPFHGSLKIRGKTFTGVVVSHKMQRSATVSWEGKRFIPKFERYMKTRTKITAHNPDCINAKEGDLVVINECRPISKTKGFVITRVLGKKEDYILEKQLETEGKHKLKKKEIANIETEKETKEAKPKKKAKQTEE